MRPELLDPYHDSGRLNALQVLLCSKLDEFLAHLGVALTRTRRFFFGVCPIHLGDNPGAVNLYHDGDLPGFWKCHTKKCHEHFKKTILGFVRGVLSSQRHGWRPDAPSKQASWKETVDFCCDFLGQKLWEIKVDYAELEKRKFSASVTAFGGHKQESVGGLTRPQVRKHLSIPSPYFVSRGWSPEILDRYDIGEYPATLEGKPLSHRAVVPVYDENHKVVVGFTGRSLFPQCEKCGRWHKPDSVCPQKDDQRAWAETAKWRNHQLDKDSHLYNFWFAKTHIRETGSIVLVESAGNVLKLEMAGVHNSVAMFGVELSDRQQILLECSGATTVVLITDMDEAGEMARRAIKERLKRSFRVHPLLLKTNDLGDMSVVQIRADVVPELKRLAPKG